MTNQTKTNTYDYPHTCIQCNKLTMQGYEEHERNPSSYRWGAIHHDCLEGISDEDERQSYQDDSAYKVCGSSSTDKIVRSNKLLKRSYWKNNGPYNIKGMLYPDVDINAVDNNGRTALMLMLKYGRKQIWDVISLVENGADVNMKDINGISVLMYASKYVGNPKIINYLIKQGADVNAKDRNGNTALMVASVRNDNSGVINALITNGAKVNQKNNYGYTALSFAYHADNNDAINQLKDAGAINYSVM